MAPIPAVKRREVVVLGRLRRFGEGQGWVAPPLSTEVIEAFVGMGLPGRSTSTCGTYRSVLRQLAGAPPPAVSAPFAGSSAKAPYSRAERAELWSMADAQRQEWRRHSARVLIALGLGAGLRCGEITEALGHQVSGAGRAATVRIDGPRARQVRVGGCYASVLLAAACRAPSDHLFHPGPADRSYHNFVNNFCTTLRADPGAPALTVARCRSSYICDHLLMGTPLAEILQATGIEEVESLLRYARHVEGAPHSKAALRRLLGVQRP